MLVNRLSDSTTDYVFVCYAHRDSTVVRQHIEWLSDHGFNVWFDDGLSGGSRWTDELAAAIDGAAAVLFFLSRESIQSKYCFDEIQFAREHDVPVLPVRLDREELTPGLRLMLGSIQILNAPDDTRAALRRKMGSALSQIMLGSPASEPTPRGRDSRVWLVRLLAIGIGLICGAIAFS